MKYKIYEESPKKDQTVFFKLTENDESIILNAVDIDGHELSTICYIDKGRGVLIAPRGVSDKLGLYIDGYRRIKIEQL
jgi:hypothetical protein